MSRDLERARYRRLDATPARPIHNIQGTQAQLGTVFDGGAMPSSSNRFFMLHPAAIVGDEAEGAAATIETDEESSFAVYFIGGAPAVGEHHTAFFVDYRWISSRRSAASVPCETGRLCLTIDSDGCSPAVPVFNADVTWTDNATPPNTIGSCKTTGVVASIFLTDGGSGYTDGTGYPLAISGDGADAAGTFDVIDGVVANVQITANGSNYTSAAIGFPGAGSGSGATATAAVKGRCCINLTHSGVHHVRVHVFGASDRTGTINATCGQDNHAAVSFPPGTLGTFCLSAFKCGVGRQGVAVSVTNAGEAVPAEKFTDEEGNVCFRLGAGPGYSYTASVGSSTFTGDFAIEPCGTTHRSIAVIGDYYFQVSADEPCSGTFTLYEGFDNTGAVIFSRSIDLAPDGFGGFESPVYHEAFSDRVNASDVYYELTFPSSTYSGGFRLRCTSPTTYDVYFAPGPTC